MKISARSQRASKLEKAARLKEGAVVISKIDDNMRYALTKGKKYYLTKDAGHKDNSPIKEHIFFYVKNDNNQVVEVSYMAFDF